MPEVKTYTDMDIDETFELSPFEILFTGTNSCDIVCEEFFFSLIKNK